MRYLWVEDEVMKMKSFEALTHDELTAQVNEFEAQPNIKATATKTHVSVNGKTYYTAFVWYYDRNDKVKL